MLCVDVSEIEANHLPDELSNNSEGSVRSSSDFEKLLLSEGLKALTSRFKS
jgi:hypothetical protein